jgi:dihydrofolate synthase/folylpolyglutamate synthase
VCGDSEPPVSLVQHATELSAPLYCQGRDFSYTTDQSSWSWRSTQTHLDNLPLPHLALQNMSTVLMAIELMQPQLPVTREAIDRGLQTVQLPGRLQVISGDIVQIFDVSHNPAAAEFLAEALAKRSIRGKTLAVFSMLADKDILGTLLVMKEWVDEWYVGALSAKRAATIPALEDAFASADISAVHTYSSVKEAYVAAMHAATTDDLVVVFGSFYTVGAVTDEL